MQHQTFLNLQIKWRRGRGQRVVRRTKTIKQLDNLNIYATFILVNPPDFHRRLLFVSWLKFHSFFPILVTLLHFGFVRGVQSTILLWLIIRDEKRVQISDMPWIFILWKVLKEGGVHFVEFATSITAVVVQSGLCVQHEKPLQCTHYFVLFFILKSHPNAES